MGKATVPPFVVKARAAVRQLTEAEYALGDLRVEINSGASDDEHADGELHAFILTLRVLTSEVRRLSRRRATLARGVS